MPLQKRLRFSGVSRVMVCMMSLRIFHGARLGLEAQLLEHRGAQRGGFKRLGGGVRSHEQALEQRAVVAEGGAALAAYAGTVRRFAALLTRSSLPAMYPPVGARPPPGF